MNSREDMDREEEKGGKKKIVVIVICIAVVILAAVLALMFLKKNDNEDKKKRQSVVTRDNLDSILTDFDASSYTKDLSQYIVTMNPVWRVKGNASDAYVENSSSNKHSVYFDVQLADTGETVYKSPVLKLGEKIENFGLDKKLDAGTYKGVVVYHLVDDDQNTLTTVKVSVEIIVEG